jgi:hypothetical protein
MKYSCVEQSASINNLPSTQYHWRCVLLEIVITASVDGGEVASKKERSTHERKIATQWKTRILADVFSANVNLRGTVTGKNYAA